MKLLARRAWLRPWVWISISAAIGAVLYCRHYWGDAPGVTLYVEAARCFLDQLPLQGCNPFYTYPPIFALLTIPLVPLPLVLQNLVWYLLTLGCLAGCFMLSARLVQRLAPGPWTPRDMRWLYAIGLVVSLKFVFAAIASQSYDAAVVLLVLAGLDGLTKEGLAGTSAATQNWASNMAGLCFALAAALKATPLLFLPYLIVKRHYRAAAVMAVALVVISLLPDLLSMLGHKTGDGYLLAWLKQIAQPALSEKLNGNLHTFWYSSNENNNSLRGLVGLFVTDGKPNFKTVLYSVYVFYSAMIALIILRTRGRSAVPIDGALLLISMLMLSPMSSESHYVALILPIFAVVALWQKGDPNIRRIAGIVLIAFFLLINAAARDLVGVAVTAWAKEYRLLVFAVLLLPVFFAIRVFASARVRAGSGTAPAITQQAT